MKTIKSVFCLLCLISLCFLGGCKMTEEQIRSIPPELLRRDMSDHLVQKETDPTAKRLPIGLVFAGLALLVGAVVYMKSDQSISLAPVPVRKRRKTVSKQRKTRKKS